jgi:mono/diheme cytochrome c family protein
MTTNEIILAVVTAVLVVFSLTVALVIPKRDPDFPGRRGLAVFFLVSTVLVLGVLASVELITEDEAEAGEVAEPPAGEPPGAPRPGDPAVGEGVFLGSAGCGSCHTLAAAGTTGTIGPNLDEAKPPYELVIDRVTNGQGIMPSFAAELGEDQIQDVAAYVVQATSG